MDYSCIRAMLSRFQLLLFSYSKGMSVKSKHMLVLIPSVVCKKYSIENVIALPLEINVLVSRMGKFVHLMIKVSLENVL